MKVSVVIPIYNAAKYLDVSLPALINQTEKNLEIILVDNGSTDSSLSKCEFYAKDDSRIKVIHTDEKIGAGEARNVGIENASGEYICFLDADDSFEPDMIEKLALAVQKSGADVAICAYDAFVEGTNRRDHHSCERKSLTDKSSVLTYAATFFPDGHIGFLWNKIYKLSIIKKNNLKFPQLSRLEDGFFNLDFFSCATSCEVIPNELYHYRISSSDDVVSKHNEEYADLVLTLVDATMDARCAWGAESAPLDELYKFCLNEIGTCIENTFIGGWGMGFLQRRSYLKQLLLIDTYEDALSYLPNIGIYRRVLHELLIREKFILLEMVVRLKYFAKKNFTKLYYLVKKG